MGTEMAAALDGSPDGGAPEPGPERAGISGCMGLSARFLYFLLPSPASRRMRAIAAGPVARR